MKMMSLEALLVASAAVFVFLQGFFNGEDSYKYVNPYILYWLKCCSGALAMGCTALKAFLSTTFADYKSRNGNGNGATKTENESPKV